MAIPKFDPKELDGPESQFMPGVKTFNYPVSMYDGVKALYDRKPVWQVLDSMDNKLFTPRIIPDNVARALIFEAGEPFDAVTQGGGLDMFGIDWEYIPVATGSMVRPGKPFIEDANEWYDKVVWPDIDSWDWEGSAKLNNGTYLKPENYNVAWFQTGWYERLISFMDFEGAIMALYDEDQQDAVKALFDKLSDLYVRIFEKYVTHFPDVHAFFIHDDWGSQKETFFSPALCEEMIVPYMKRVTDFLHSKGKMCILHSCGQLLKQVPNIIAAGWDAWGPQLMNDTHKIYELYGDKLLIGVDPAPIAEDATEEQQRAAAREYADKFCNPKKPSFFNFYSASKLTPAFREEMYKQSRINYSK
ncbi:MAG: methyltransferase [Oscillospiraceae bacterium]|nr:methyltransferase [Oscillospiraceae bacterium]